MKHNKVILKDIVQAASFVIEFQQGLDWASFTADLKTQSAIIHQLFIMGEAVKHLPKEFQSLHPEIPWSKVAQMRDKLIHGYDIQQVWKTAVFDVPALLTLIEPLLSAQEEA